VFVGFISKILLLACLQQFTVEVTTPPVFIVDVQTQHQEKKAEKVTQRQWYLVSESWCSNCPRAKKAFLAKGWPESNVLTLAQCQQKFGFRPSHVPFEFGEPQQPGQTVVQAQPVRSIQTYSRLPVVQTPWGVQDLETYERRHTGCKCSMCQGIRGIIAGYRNQKTAIQSSAVIKQPEKSPEIVQFGQENTPWPIIEQMVRLMSLKPSDTLADLGCGDGRVLIAASTMTGCRAIGVEIDKAKCEQAVRNVESAGLSAKITIINDDVNDFDPVANGVTAISAYLYPDLLEKISGKFYSVRVAASPYHRAGALNMEKHGDVWIFRNDSIPVN
jgi:hypothetical protein